MVMTVIVWILAANLLFAQGFLTPQCLTGYKGINPDLQQKLRIHECRTNEIILKNHQKENPADTYYFADTVNSYSYSDGDTKRLNTYDDNGNLITVLFKRRISEVWVDSLLNTYTYDGSGRPLTGLAQIWNNGAWEYSNRYTYTYDGSGNSTTYLSERWENGSWVNSVLGTMTHDGDGNMLTSLLQTWDNGVWVNSFLTTYTYDTERHMLSYLMQTWNGTGWDNLQYSTYTWDTSGNMVLLVGQMWFGGVWMNMMQITYTYDGNGNMLTRFRESWNGGAWSNHEFTTQTWDGDNILSVVNQDWLGEWVNVSEELYTYDGDGNRLSLTELKWDGGDWLNDMKSEFEYSPGKITGYGFMWNGSDWVTDELIMVVSLNNNGNGGAYFIGMAYYAEIFYSAYVMGIEASGKEPSSLVTVYPNPSNDRITIATTIGETGRASISLFDLSGNLVSVIWEGTITAGMHPITYNTQGISSGLYMLELKAGTHSSRQKVTIIN